MISWVRLLVYTCTLFGPLTRFLSVDAGDRIAQLIVERIYTPDICEVDVGQHFSCPKRLNDTLRRSWTRPLVAAAGLVRLGDTAISDMWVFQLHRSNVAELESPLRTDR